MKTLLALIVAVSVVGSAFAVTPQQAGLYSGKLTTTGADFETKKPFKQTESAIMIIEPDGSTQVVFEMGGVLNGDMILGTYRGALDTGIIKIAVESKGTKLTGKTRIVEVSGPDSGVIVELEFKMKRSKNQPDLL